MTMRSELHPPPDAPRWRVDRTIPLPMIVALVVQTLGVVWWLSGYATRHDLLEKRVEAQGGNGERLVRLETKMDGVVDNIRELKVLVQRSH